MLTPSDETRTHVQLRQSAEAKIQTGIAPGTQGWNIGAAALTLLHSLASNPATGADALKLLHELQVHQVELDLQHEHMEEDRRELTQRVDHYAGLYDQMPVAYFTVDSADQIIEGNPAAARLLGTQQDGLEGRSIHSLAATDSGPELHAALARAHSSGLRQGCRIEAADGTGWLEVAAIASSRRHTCQVIVMDLSTAS
jgi:PAS domain S-box-containing protein